MPLISASTRRCCAFVDSIAWVQSYVRVNGSRPPAEVFGRGFRLTSVFLYPPFFELPAERIEQPCREHLAILDAVENGDLEWAEALLRQHLKQAHEYGAGERD